MTTKAILVAMTAGASLFLSGAANAQGMQQGDGMMHGGMMQGGAMRGGMMQGDMGGGNSGAQQGGGMMPGVDAGQGMGGGMMGGGMMGHGMMGGDMMGRGQAGGMMGHGMMGGAPAGMEALFGSRVTPVMNLSVDDVRGYLGQQIARLANKRLKVGDIKATDDRVIIADIVTVDNSLVQRLKVDRRTGAIDYVE